MPRRDEPRVTLRLSFALDGRLEGAAKGAGVKKGTLARRAMELGMDAAIVEARGEVGGSPAARGTPLGESAVMLDRAAVRAGAELVGAAPARLDGVVAARVGGMLEARRAINAGLVRVDGRVVRDPMELVPAGARVVVDA